MSEMVLIERLLDLARKEKKAWSRAFTKYEKQPHGEDSAEACLQGLNAVDQLLTKMEREVRLDALARPSSTGKSG